MTKKGLRLFGSKGATTNKQPQRQRVLFVSHEASRTGAPMIILNILKHFKENCDIQCETILHNGGHLTGDFGRHSCLPVDCLNIERKQSEDLRKKVSRIVNREKGNLPLLAICNSMESRFISNEIAALGIPVVSLVHELPSSYSEEDYQNVYNHSEKVVFPVEAVRKAADQKTQIPSGKGMVLPQGLLKPDFGKGVSREESIKQIRTELGLPQDSFIVLGCGTLDLRKGIDHFAAIARQVVKSNKSDREVHFVWVGDGPRWTHSPFHYVQLDLAKSDAESHVHFIGERANVEPYFVGADAFLMSSRVDPFPCVIHEAMVTGLPVITFNKSGGAPEAVSGGAGIVVPYADYDQTAGIIQMLCNQPEVAEGIRERSKAKVDSRYQFSDYGDKLVDLAESILGKSIRNQVQEQINGPRLHRPAA